MALADSELDAWVAKVVDAVEAIDVHTHVLPPTHGSLLLYGIDELLCYHYLVAELFMVRGAVARCPPPRLGESERAQRPARGWE